MDDPVSHKINNWPDHKALENLVNITAIDLLYTIAESQHV